MSSQEKFPTTQCHHCGGEGLSGEYVSELCGEGEDRPCEHCKGTGHLTLPWKYEVCERCDGYGTDRGASVECDGGGFTADEWREQDDEFREDYLAGRYDRPCSECGGRRVVAVPDRVLCAPALLEAYDKTQQEEAEYQAMCAMERRYGA